MNIVIAKPPIWDTCNEKFKLLPGTVFTYGSKLYNPDNVDISPDLMAHEKCHSMQQGQSDELAKIWWDKYLSDPEFRLDQEVRAYSAQYRFVCAKNKDKNQRDRYLRFFAKTLSSPLYGCNITEFGASEAIKHGYLQ